MRANGHKVCKRALEHRRSRMTWETAKRSPFSHRNHNQGIDFLWRGIDISETSMRAVMDGIWIHHDRMHDRRGRRAAYEYITPRCGYANVYRGRNPTIKQIDTICGGCGKRVRFDPHRLMWKSRRGSIRQVQWLHEGKPRRVLESIAKELNQIDESEHTEGFTRASNYSKENRRHQRGGKRARFWRRRGL